MTTRTLSIAYKAEVESAFNAEEFSVALLSFLQRNIQLTGVGAALTGTVQLQETTLYSRVFSLNANGYVDTDGGDRLIPNSHGTFTRMKNPQ